jgi:hypothetical protein
MEFSLIAKHYYQGHNKMNIRSKNPQHTFLSDGK